MSYRTTLSGPVTGGSGVLLLARVLAGVAGGGFDLLNQGSVTSLAYTVTNLTTGLAVGSGTLVVSASVFNSLQQTDPRWTQDSAQNPGPDGLWGYNFATTLAASLFPPASPAVGVAATRYQADVAFTMVSGQPFRVSWQWNSFPVYG